MDQSRSSDSPSSKEASAASENPIVAAGQRAKSALKDQLARSSLQNRPSVRILRDPSSLRSAGNRDATLPIHRRAAESLVPHLSPHAKAHGPEGRQDLVQHFAGHADAYSPAPKEQGITNRFRGSVGSFFADDGGQDDENPYDDEYDRTMVDLLDVVDPEVSTLSTLTNIQNSLFVPSLGKVVNRRPTYKLKERPLEERMVEKLKGKLKDIRSAIQEKRGKDSGREQEYNFQYAVLPEGETLEGWNPQQKAELDDTVRHMLHSRRARFKRSMKGFGQYVRRPFGLFITLYATLITLFGAAWVFFLIGWISLGSRKDYIVNVVDNVLVGLFAIIGDGLAPFRAVDTYHMFFIAKYHRKTWKLRKKLGLPDLVDHNDLPDQQKEEMELERQLDLESQTKRHGPRAILRRMRQRIGRKDELIDDAAPQEYTVLTEEEQTKLEYHERKFSKSHTFYKPHETETHYAFPLKLLVAIVILLDIHSCLQISLGACTWGISYKTRPFALTTVILCCSITCNIMGGVLISKGDKKTRKKDVIERIMYQELTTNGKDDLEKKWLKELDERGEVPAVVKKRYERDKAEKEQKEHEEIKKAWKDVPLLPKKLLGKGEDHRQPSLPKKGRKGSSQSSITPSTSSSGSSTAKTKTKPSSQPELAPVQEAPQQPALPEAAARRSEEPKEGTRQKVMKFIRRADLDRS